MFQCCVFLGRQMSWRLANPISRDPCCVFLDRQTSWRLANPISRDPWCVFLDRQTCLRLANPISRDPYKISKKQLFQNQIWIKTAQVRAGIVQPIWWLGYRQGNRYETGAKDLHIKCSRTINHVRLLKITYVSGAISVPIIRDCAQNVGNF
jgi:hypothetical protein